MKPARHRGNLRRRLGDVGEGLALRRPGPDLASYPLSQVPDEAAVIVRALLTADRNQSFLRSQMTDEQRAADAGPRLPAVPDRRRRHRPRRRSARAQPRPPLRRGRRDRLPHRGPASGHEEVRPPGRQGARRVRRADQAPERGALPARRDGRARDHRRAHRRRGGDAARRPRRRARPAVPARRDEREPAGLQDLHARVAPQGVPPTPASTSSTGIGSTRSPTTNTRKRPSGSSAPKCSRSRSGTRSATRRAIPRSSSAVRRGGHAPRRGLGGRGRAQDLRRGGGRRARVPRERGRVVRR